MRSRYDGRTSASYRIVPFVTSLAGDAEGDGVSIGDAMVCTIALQEMSGEGRSVIVLEVGLASGLCGLIESLGTSREGLICEICNAGLGVKMPKAPG